LSKVPPRSQTPADLPHTRRCFHTSEVSSMLNFSGWFQRANPAYEHAEKLIAEHRYADAETALISAIDEMKARSVPHTRQAKFCLALATAQWKLAKRTLARENANIAHGILDARNRPSRERAATLDLLGEIEAHNHRNEEAK